jgi:hypothetical protein
MKQLGERDRCKSHYLTFEWELQKWDGRRGGGGVFHFPPIRIFMVS